MLLSPDQVKSFWRLWPQACRANGWTREAGFNAEQIDAKRKEILRECGFNSLTQVDRIDGFTKVKNKLLILIGVDVQAGKEDQDTTENKGRNHRWVIEHKIIPCLSLYEEDVTAYVATVISGLIRYYKTDRPNCPPTLSDLDVRPNIRTARTGKRKGQSYEMISQMEQCLITLSARVDARRKAAGDSIHDMKIKAGLECNCRQCCRRHVTFSRPTAVPAGDPDWSVL